MNYFMEREPQKRLTFRLRDPFGYLLFEMNVLLPASMVEHVMTDWTNTLDIKADRNANLPYQLDVVLK